MRNIVKLIFISSLLILFISVKTYSQESQNQCKVLKEEISVWYQGDCKDGFAHGKGIAGGVDRYEGTFKNGLPNGSGKYMWRNGNYYDGHWRKGKKSGKGIFYNKETDTELKGIWKDDVFFKEIKDPPYQVTLKYGITGTSFYKEDENEPYEIELIFQKDGNQSRSVGQLQLVSSNGSTKVSGNFSGFENVLFPFEGYVEFYEPNRMGTVTLRYELKFKIIEEGSWKIIIRY